MFARKFLATLFSATLPLTVQAASDPATENWFELSGSNTNTTIVNRSTSGNLGRYVDVQVLRDFNETVTLGNDPATGVPRYPHRSVTLQYTVDCAASRLAVSEWQMFEGNLATGQIVWDQTNRNAQGFVPAVNAEMRAVMRSACATNTVSR